jgi:hypothetical protein
VGEKFTAALNICTSYAIILQRSMINLIDHTTYQSNLRGKYMQIRKDLIFFKVKWKNLSKI